jgi:hypothetical protein
MYTLLFSLHTHSLPAESAVRISGSSSSLKVLYIYTRTKKYMTHVYVSEPAGGEVTSSHTRIRPGITGDLLNCTHDNHGSRLLTGYNILLSNWLMIPCPTRIPFCSCCAGLGTRLCWLGLGRLGLGHGRWSLTVYSLCLFEHH